MYVPLEIQGAGLPIRETIRRPVRLCGDVQFTDDLNVFGDIYVTQVNVGRIDCERINEAYQQPNPHTAIVLDLLQIGPSCL